jgi:3'(2'), 5'-bisphosphate nucleotidase
MDFSFLVEGVKKAAIDAGQEILEVYEDESKFQITQKADESPLTIADQRANNVICKKLEELTPEIPIISEENKEIPFSERKNFTYAWLVDPLDGTKEFIKRNGEFTVNIALIRKGQIVFGVVYIPVTDEIFWALKEHGAYYSKNGQDSQSLQAPSFDISDEGLNVVCSRSHLNDDTADFIAKLNKPNKVSKGSSLKFLILAQGGAHVYPRLAPTMEWDTGAAQIILEESGGKVINVETDEPLDYNKESLRNPFFIAYGNVST